MTNDRKRTFKAKSSGAHYLQQSLMTRRHIRLREVAEPHSTKAKRLPGQSRAVAFGPGLRRSSCRVYECPNSTQVKETLRHMLERPVTGDAGAPQWSLAGGSGHGHGLPHGRRHHVSLRRRRLRDRRLSRNQDQCLIRDLSIQRPVVLIRHLIRPQRQPRILRLKRRPRQLLIIAHLLVLSQRKRILQPRHRQRQLAPTAVGSYRLQAKPVRSSHRRIALRL